MSNEKNVLEFKCKYYGNEIKLFTTEDEGTRYFLEVHDRHFRGELVDSEFTVKELKKMRTWIDKQLKRKGVKNAR